MSRRTLVLTGANGFIGRHLLNRLPSGFDRIVALTRTPPTAGPTTGLEWVKGDMADPEVWSRMLVQGCTVVNLAYSQVAASGGAVDTAKSMVEACAQAQVARFIHCSTVSVYGRTVGGAIDEGTACNPLDGYGRQKLAVERALLDAAADRFELAVLRPAAVFGQGGQGLRSLCASLTGGSPWTSYARSCLFGHRRMHLVPVETVTAAICFLVETERPVRGDVFIVANDEDPLNNFRDVERILMEELQVPAYRLPRVALPPGLLSAVLKWRGRSEIDPIAVYQSHKLHQWGFAAPVQLEQTLRAFARQSRRPTDHEIQP